MTDAPLSHWLFLYGTMLLYFAIGAAGLWLSARSHGRKEGDSGKSRGPT